MPRSNDCAGVVVQFPLLKEVAQPVLVLEGLHVPPPGHLLDSPDQQRALSNCRSLLSWARAGDMPIAFARRVSSATGFGEAYPTWLRDFVPTKRDMVFDIAQLSLYGNAEFARAISYFGGRFLLVGRLGKLDGLHTAMDARQRGHCLTLISDAFVVEAPLGVPPLLYREVITEHIVSYGEVSSTSNWIPSEGAGSSPAPDFH